MVKILVVDHTPHTLIAAIKLAHSKSAVDAQPELLNNGLAIFERQIRERVALPKHLVEGKEETTASATGRAMKEAINRKIDNARTQGLVG